MEVLLQLMENEREKRISMLVLSDGPDVHHGAAGPFIASAGAERANGAASAGPAASP